MKISDREKEQWLLASRAKKAKTRFKQLRRRRHTNRHPEFTPPHLVVNRHNPGQKQPVDQRVEIVLPRDLNLDENYDATIVQLNNVRLSVDGRIKIGHLSFNEIKTISPSAALLLASEVDRWNAFSNRRLKARHNNWDPAIKRLMCQMGFFELLGIMPPRDWDGTSNATFLRFIGGKVDDKATAGEKAKNLRKEIELAAGTEIKKHLLFEALTEAITNVSQHAYGRTREGIRGWWMAGAIDQQTRMITVTFCDHGLTIPGTLKPEGLAEGVRDVFGAWDDGQKIKAAMQFGRSATGHRERGKGLQNFLEIIKSHPGSRLRIFSNRGVLRVSNEALGDLKFESLLVETPLKGTLIEWQFVPITKPDS